MEIAGALAGALLAILTLLLPRAFGGYMAWSDFHIAFHNLVATVVRIVVFAMAGAALAGMWRHRHRARH